MNPGGQALGEPESEQERRSALPRYPCLALPSFRGPQSARDLQEPRFERDLHLLKPVERNPTLDQDACDLSADCGRSACRQRDPEAQQPDLDVSPDCGGLEE